MERLAAAIAERYGLPAAAISGRMAAGRFRVKSNVDRDTAMRFATDLERLGAVCTMEEAEGAGSADIVRRATAPTQAATPAAVESAPPPSPAPPAAPAARTSALSFAEITPPPAAAEPGGPLSGALSAARPTDAPANPAQGDFETGLSAAFGGGDSSQDLGALMGGGGGSLSVSSLDGDDEPAPQKAAAPAAVDMGDPGSEALFAPPEQATEADLLSLAPERPEPVQPPPSFGDDSAGGFPVGEAAPMPAAPAAASANKQRGNPLAMLASSDRVRFAAGVFAAVLIGFLPAHFVSGCQEDSKYGAIDKKIAADYAEVKSPEDWDALEDMLRAQKTAKESAQANIAITGFGVWLVAGGLLGFLWFRKIDWDRFLPRDSDL